MTTAAALTYNALHGPSYTARMRLLVAPGGASLGNAQAEGGATLVISDHGQAARNLAALLSDPGFAAAMVSPPPAAAFASPPWTRLISRGTAQRLGLSAGLDTQEAFAARLARGFSAAALGDTDVAELVLSWDDPRFVAAGLDAIAAGTQRAVSDASAGRAALAQAQSRVSEAQGALDALDASGRPPIDDARATRARASVLARLDTARAQADQIRLAIELARRGGDGVDADFRGGGWVAAPEAGAGPGDAAGKFAALLEQKQALMGKPVANPRALAAIDGKIAQLREHNYQQVRAHYADQVAAAQARLAPVASAIAEDEASLRDLDARAAEAAVLARDRAAKLARLALQTARLRQAQQHSAWEEVGAVRVLSQARPPTAPDWPAPWLVLRGSILAGLALGLLSAALAERRRHTIDYASDITRRLGIEVLARLGEEAA